MWNLFADVDAKAIIKTLADPENDNFILNNLTDDVFKIEKRFQGLNFLLLKNLTASSVLGLLHIENSQQKNLGMLLCNLSAAVLQPYIQFLFHLARRLPNNEALLDLLLVKDKNAHTLLVMMAQRHDIVNLLKTIELLKVMRDDGADSCLLEKLISPAFIYYLVATKNVIVIHELLTCGFLTKTMQPMIYPLKAALAEHILTIANPFFRTVALRNALDQDHPCGKFFNHYYFYSAMITKFKNALLQNDSPSLNIKIG